MLQMPEFLEREPVPEVRAAVRQRRLEPVELRRGRRSHERPGVRGRHARVAVRVRRARVLHQPEPDARMTQEPDGRGGGDGEVPEARAGRRPSVPVVDVAKRTRPEPADDRSSAIFRGGRSRYRRGVPRGYSEGTVDVAKRTRPEPADDPCRSGGVVGTRRRRGTRTVTANGRAAAASPR